MYLRFGYKKLPLVISLCLFFFLPASVFSQAQEQPVSIGKLNFASDRTKRTAFDRSFGRIEGKKFKNQQDLDAFIENLRQRITKSERFRAFTLETTPAGNGIVDVDITIVDSWYGIGAAVPFYTTSMGFIAGGGAIFPNVNGYLFDFILAAVYIAEPHMNGLAWNDPTYQGSFGVSKIPLGHELYLGASAEVIRNAQSSYDRGVEVYRSRALFAKFNTILTWEPTLEWSVYAGTIYQAGFLPEIVMNFRPEERYGTLSRNFFSQDLKVKYDGATRDIDGIPVGTQSIVMVAYSFNDTFFEGVDHAFQFSTDISYTWNVAGIFFPTLSAYTSYKTGIPLYNLASQMRGIFDGEWKGNGVSRMSADFLFHVYEFPKWIFIHMGPFVDYGVAYGPNQNFETNNDQGASVGLRFRLLFPLAPSTPVFIDIGYDLRDKYAWSDFRRFEFVMGSSFSL